MNSRIQAGWPGRARAEIREAYTEVRAVTA
jgi:hypothetical protein